MRSRIPEELFKKLPIHLKPGTGQLNRTKSRKVNAEISKHLNKFFELENEFIEELFLDGVLSYDHIYRFYLDQWKKLQDQVRPTLKHSILNDDYFVDLYKPLEEPKQESNARPDYIP